MIPLLRYQDVLWALSARVGGVEMPFLLDTAAGVTTLDRAFAERLGVGTRGTFRGERMTGEVVTLDLGHDVEITLGDRRIAHETVGVFDLAALLPPDWPPLGGAIGLPSFASVLATLDLAGACLVLDAEPAPGARELHVRAQRDGPAVDLFAEVGGPTRPLWLEIDTGNTGAVILSPDAGSLLGVTAASGEVALDVVGLGSIPTPVVVKPIRYDGNLGAPFFATRPLTIDLANERAWLEDRA